MPAPENRAALDAKYETRIADLLTAEQKELLGKIAAPAEERSGVDGSGARTLNLGLASRRMSCILDCMRYPVTSATRLLIGVGLVSAMGCVRTLRPDVVIVRSDPAPGPGDGKYVLTLDNALMDGRALELHLCGVGGRFRQAWGITPPGGNVAQWADASELRTRRARLRGFVRTRVDDVLYEYKLDLPVPADAGADVEIEPGRFLCRQGMTEPDESSGSLSGVLLPPVDPNGATQVELHLGKAIHGPNDWHRQVLLTFDFAGGRATNVSARPDTGRHVSWTAQTRELAVGLGPERLSGKAGLDFRMGGKTNSYTFEIRGNVRAGVIDGDVISYLDGKETLLSRCSGFARANGGGDPTRDDAICKLVLTNAAIARHNVELYVERRAGRSVAAAALVPHARDYAHAADVSQLRVEEDAASGCVTVNVRPAGWPGWDSKPTLCEFSIQAEFGLADGGHGSTGAASRISGRYEKRQQVETREGSVTGRRRPWARIKEENSLAKGMNYAQWRGPHCNGTGPSSGYELVDDLTESRLVWRSEEETPDSWLWSKNTSPYVGGGYASPVIAHDRLYVAYYVPSGEAIDTAQVARFNVPVKWLLDADDVVLCADAITGATIWKTTFPGRGVNLNVHLSGPHMTTCVSGDAVYAFGSAGDIYCLDAATGGVKWRSDLGPEAERVRALKEESFRARKLVDTTGQSFCGSPVVAGGSLICNDSSGGLFALDAATGDWLWGPVTDCVAGTSTPSVWRYGGTNYILAAGARLVCLDPRTGRMLWGTAENVANQGSLALADLDGEHYVVCGGLTCFKITPAGAEQVWHLGGGYNLHVTSPLIYGDHVYPWRGGPAVCVDLRTGDVKGEAAFWSVRGCSSFVASDGKIVRPHLRNQLLYYDADPGNFRQLGELWRPASFAGSTTPVMLDGRLFFRGGDCIYCYDLRKR